MALRSLLGGCKAGDWELGWEVELRHRTSDFRATAGGAWKEVFSEGLEPRMLHIQNRKPLPLSFLPGGYFDSDMTLIVNIHVQKCTQTCTEQMCIYTLFGI